MFRVLAIALFALFSLSSACAQTSYLPNQSGSGLAGTVVFPDTISSQPAATTATRNPDDVTNQFKFESKHKDTLFNTEGIDRALAPWNEFKDRLSEQYGLDLGIFYTTVYQKADATITNPGMRDNQDEGASGILGIAGTWNLIGRGSNSPGRLGFRLNDRHRFTQVPPQSLGSDIGSLWPTAIAFNEFDMALIELYWEQHLVKDRLAFRVGKTIPFAIHDYFTLKSPTSAFLDANLTFNPAIGWVGFAFGGTVAVRPTTDFYVIGGVYDANGKQNRAGIDDFFNEKEYFSIVDVGWDPGYLDPSRKVKIGPFEVSDIHASFWHKDAVMRAGTPEGRGVSVFAEFQAGRFLPFFRYGYSEGVNGGSSPALLNHMVAGGVGIKDIFGQKDDVIGVGVTWGKSELGRLDINLDQTEFVSLNLGSVEQTAVQAYYRIQLTQEIHVTPSLQYIFNPAFNPSEDQIAVFSIRGRVEF